METLGHLLTGVNVVRELEINRLNKGLMLLICADFKCHAKHFNDVYSKDH